VGSYSSFYPKKDYKREGSTSREKPKETTKPLAKDASTPPIQARDVKCFKCYGRGHVQAQCPNQRTLFLKGVDEYTSGEDEPCEREEGGEDERVAPLEGELLMIRRTLNKQPSTSMETQRENIFHTKCNVLENICSCNYHKKTILDSFHPNFLKTNVYHYYRDSSIKYIQ